MFVELFQMIYNNFGQWLLEIGLSSATVYSVYRIIKGLIHAIFLKKKQKLAKQAEQSAIATATAEEVAKVLKPEFVAITTDLTSTKTQLEVVKNEVQTASAEKVEEVAIDIVAYQTLMLAQDPELRIKFEQIKAKLIEASKNSKEVVKEVCETTTEVANNVTEAIKANEENILNATESVAKTAKKAKETAKKVKKKAETVYYD